MRWLVIFLGRSIANKGKYNYRTILKVCDNRMHNFDNIKQFGEVR